MLTARGTDSASRWDLSCPGGRFVVSISGRGGNALDQLTLQCASMTLSKSGAAWVGQVGPAIQIDGPAAGGSSGGRRAAACPQGQIATLSSPRVLTNNGLVSSLGIGCSTVTAR